MPEFEDLQLWFNRWLEKHRDSNLIYKTPAEQQIIVARDVLAPLVWRGRDYDSLPLLKQPHTYHENAKSLVTVIGEHTSKSVPLPVYFINRPDIGFRVVMRDNFHDWNVTIISETPVPEEAMRGFVKDYDPRKQDRRVGESWGYCFFQGFPDEYRLGPWAHNHCRFSLWTDGSYDLFALLWSILSPRWETKHGQ